MLLLFRPGFWGKGALKIFKVEDNKTCRIYSLSMTVSFEVCAGCMKQRRNMTCELGSYLTILQPSSISHLGFYDFIIWLWLVADITRALIG